MADVDEHGGVRCDVLAFGALGAAGQSRARALDGGARGQRGRDGRRRCGLE